VTDIGRPFYTLEQIDLKAPKAIQRRDKAWIGRPLINIAPIVKHFRARARLVCDGVAMRWAGRQLEFEASHQSTRGCKSDGM
jgi:hypothetical protein